MYKALKNWKSGVLALVGFTFSFSSLAQELGCGNASRLRKLYAEHPEMQADHDKFMQNVFNNRIVYDDSTIYTIPIVFHIIHRYGSENVPDANILSEITVLNRDYNKLNADTATVIPEFVPKIANVRLKFVLPTIDPDGNCTNGINHYYSHEYQQGDDYSKLHQWDRDKYLNVWLVDKMENGVAGYAYYPDATVGFLAFADGVIILNDYVGTLSPSSAFNSRALTHEIGHYLSLSHTWGSTNDPTVACGDDAIADTPETKGHNNCTNRFDNTCDLANLSGAYKFDSLLVTSGQTDPTPPPTQSDSSITYSQFTAHGVSANSTLPLMASYKNWGDTLAANGETVYSNFTGMVDPTRYYEFTLTPVFGNDYTLTGITFTVGRDTNGCRTYVVRSSVDGYAANLTASISPANSDLSVQTGNVFMINNDTNTNESGSKITLSGSNYTLITAPRTFRIYAFNCEDTSGTFLVDNVNVTGNYGLIENVENYMEYSYCSKMFTLDQKYAMRTTLNQSISYRNNLWAASNIVATGTDVTSAPLCAPVADFYPNEKYVCNGDNVTFHSASWRGAVTTYDWSFPGGTPSTSTAATPVVNYTTPGFHQATLTVSNATGSDTKTVEQSVYVSNAWTDFYGPYNESFENPATSDWWICDNDENNEAMWHRVNMAASSNGSYCMMLNNHKETDIFSFTYFDQLGGNVDGLISPSFNLSNTTGATLTFKYSCATHATAVADILEELNVYSTINCGKNWNLKKSITGVALTNGGVTGSGYVPGNSSGTYWTPVTISLGTTTGATNMRFKFEYTASDKSNNIYIDEINVNGTIGILENPEDVFSFNVYPNPVNLGQSLKVDITGQTELMNVTVNDVIGNVIFTKSLMNSNGSSTVEIPVGGLSVSKGVYFVSVGNSDFKQTKKIVVQ
jgi:PKD repeat protein